MHMSSCFIGCNNVTWSHLRVVGVDARNDLRDDHQPSVDADKTKALLQRCLHIGGTAPREPQREQPQDVLQVAGAVASCLAQRNTAAAAAAAAAAGT
jgi:hypothetical protein